jgi:xanthine dehydrogenase accessory factor
VFIDVYQPRPRLVIVGGAHAAVALAQMASLLGFRVMLVDPRRAFATAERFPTAERITYEYPDKALPKIGLTSQTYIAVLTHDPKIDDPALKTALPSAAPYIGILSSKRTHEQRIERLTAAGLDRALLDRIRTPIGLKIGAQTPEEIALCVMAEIIAVRRGALV